MLETLQYLFRTQMLIPSLASLHSSPIPTAHIFKVYFLTMSIQNYQTNWNNVPSTYTQSRFPLDFVPKSSIYGILISNNWKIGLFFYLFRAIRYYLLFLQYFYSNVAGSAYSEVVNTIPWGVGIDYTVSTLSKNSCGVRRSLFIY